jgi:putative aldouronate transport system substrate-binding protein
MTGSLLMGLYGCSAAENTVSVDTQQQETTQESLEPVTFTFYSADGLEDTWTDPVAQMITEKTGVTLKMDYPADSNDNRIELMVATGEYPDFVFAKGSVSTLIRNDALIDMSDLIDEYGPNIKKLYGDEYENLRYSSEDPSIYQLCSDKVQEETLETSGTAQLQWAVLQENQYRVPYTLEEYTQMIRDYMEKYPMINGKPAIGISIVCSDWHWYTMLSNPSGYMNGSADNGQWIVDDEKQEVYYKHAADGQKEYYKWLNEMYNEGILDPEFATQTHEDFVLKVAEGRVLGLLDEEWDYTGAEISLRADGQEEHTYAGLPVTIDRSVKCPSLKQQNLAVGWGIGITKSCKDPVRAVRFLDWLCSDEAQILLNWGIEGVDYYYDENGKRCITEEDLEASRKDTNYSERTGVGFRVYPYPSYGNQSVDSTGNSYSKSSREMVKEGYDEMEKEALKAWNVDMLTDIFPQKEEFSKDAYSPLWALTLPDELEKMLVALDNVSWKGLIECVVSPADDFDAKWDELQQNLKDAGLEKADREMTALLRDEISRRE